MIAGPQYPLAARNWTEDSSAAGAEGNARRAAATKKLKCLGMIFLQVITGYTRFMSIDIEKEKIPLAKDADGVIRVSGTRIALESVIAAFQEGATAQEIGQQYPSLPLADVYAVIGYYLKHRSSLDVYLRGRDSKRAEVQQKNESRFNPRAIRERILGRSSAARPKP
jgi:uncharacterized protein (DUF433 family)